MDCGHEGGQPTAASDKKFFSQVDSALDPGVRASGLHNETPASVDEIEEGEKGRLAYFKTRNFYIVLVLGYVS